MKKIFLCITLFLALFYQVSANIEIHSEQKDAEKIITIENGVLKIYGDVTLGDYYSLGYPVEIFGDLKTKTHVKLKNNITVHGNVVLGNYSKVYRNIVAEDLSTHLRVEIYSAQAKNIYLGGENTIYNGVFVEKNFDAGSDLILKGKSFIGGDFSVLKDAKISGNLIILGNAKGHFDFEFKGEKLVVRGQFRTLEDSFLQGRIYMFASQGHKYKYGNKLWKYRYAFSKLIYKDFFGKVDPFLQYNLSENQVNQARKIVKQYDQEMEDLQKKYTKNYAKMSMGEKMLHRSQAEELLENKFIYISQFIGNNNWQKTEFKKLEYQQKNELKKFFAQIYY